MFRNKHQKELSGSSDKNLDSSADDLLNIWTEYVKRRRRVDHGLEAEYLVVELASYFNDRQVVFNGIEIVKVIHCRNDLMDHNEVDVLLFLSNGLALPIQVKLSTKRGVINSHYESHPYVLHVFSVGALPKIKWDDVYRCVLHNLEQFILHALGGETFPS